MIKQVSYLFFLLLLLFTSCKKESLADIECLVWHNGQFELIKITKAAEYKDGGENGFARAILSSISYPAEAREKGIEGTVDLTYEISELGIIENVTIINDIGGGCGDAAKKAIEMVSISFSPAEINGSPVRIKKEVPVLFRLE